MMILTVAAMASCGNDNCMGNSSGIPLAAFMEGNNKVTLSDLTVYGIGAPNDSAIIRNTSASQVYMPFSITETTCSDFVTRYQSARKFVIVSSILSTARPPAFLL